MIDLRIGQPVYFTRILPKLEIYELYDLVVRLIAEDWFSAYDTRTKQAFLFKEEDIEVTVFTHRSDALDHIREEEMKNDDGESKN